MASGGAPGSSTAGTGLGGAGARPAAEAGSASTEGGEGGDSWSPPEPVAPEVSRAWTWEPCGTLEPTAPDREALFDDAGRVVVLGASDLRVYDRSGALVSSTKAAADSLIAGPDGSVLSAKATTNGVELTRIGEGSPQLVLPPAPDVNCGSRFAFSFDGAHLFTTDGAPSCAWRVSDATFVGRSQGPSGQLATVVRGSQFVSLSRSAGDAVLLVRGDFAGNPLSSVQLDVTGSATLSPAGDRAVVGGQLVDLDTGKVVAWGAMPDAYGPAVFSARGDVVLFGGHVFRASDGARLFSLAPGGRLAQQGEALTLSSDGSRVVQSIGRATLFDVEAPGVAAFLGPPNFRDGPNPGNSSDLAISADGSLLVHNVANHVAFGIRLAPTLAESQVLWTMRAEINLGVDVTPDGKFAAVGGDGRVVYDARDGSVRWGPSIPPPGVVLEDICLLDRLRFSPRATWLAGTYYGGQLQVFRFDGGRGSVPWESSGAVPSRCDAPIFSHDEQLLATSAAALYRWSKTEESWRRVWSEPLPQASLQDSLEWTTSDAVFSPDEQQLLVSRCGWNSGCSTTLLATATGEIIRLLPELTAQHPSFSPDGSWLVAADKLVHLPSGDLKTLGANADATSPALFAPNGDILAGSPNGTLTRYCRRD